MPLSVKDNHFLEIERRDAFEASDIHAELIRIRASLVVRIDPADGAEVMLGGLCVKAVGSELVFALRDPEIFVR